MSSNIPGGPKSPGRNRQEMAKLPSIQATLLPPQPSSCPDPTAPGEQTVENKNKKQREL